jgi:hypothetical protein
VNEAATITDGPVAVSNERAARIGVSAVILRSEETNRTEDNAQVSNARAARTEASVGILRNEVTIQTGDGVVVSNARMVSQSEALAVTAAERRKATNGQTKTDNEQVSTESTVSKHQPGGTLVCHSRGLVNPKRKMAAHETNDRVSPVKKTATQVLEERVLWIALTIPAAPS